MNITRKNFFIGSLATVAVGAAQEKTAKNSWEPYSHKKVRVGIAGYGVCSFGAAFSFQTHPNVEVVAAADLFKDRAERLAQLTGAKRIYLSAEEMMDKEAGKMDAVFIATDAKSHIDLVLRALDRGYHVASVVPALLGVEQLDRAEKLIESVKKSGLVYAMFETTAFRPQTVAMRNIHKAGGFGRIGYTEGEYFHFSNWSKPIDSYNGWRTGLPPQYYPTHANGFYTCVTHGSFTEVSCIGITDPNPIYSERKNPYKNPFRSEVAFFKTTDEGSARMTVSWGFPGYSGETGRCFGTKGCYRNDRYVGDNSLIKDVKLVRDDLPPGMYNNGHHGGSHPYLTEDFIRAILLPGHKVCVDAACALNTTVSGVYAHLSALKGGEMLKIPQFSL